MIKYLQRRYALSHKGAVDNIKGILSCALQNISFMLPVGLLYLLVGEIMNGTLTTKRIPFYMTGCIAAALLIVVCTRLEYDNTYLVTYVESGVRRVNLAEKLRKIPLSFFGKKDLADLTSSIMNDCAVLEQSQSHFVAPLYGAILSTTVIAVSLLFFNWRMALAAIWPLPVAFAIVALASGVQKRLSSKAMAAKITCEDGIQECMETMPDLRANNAEAGYLAGLEKKIRAVEGRLIKSELGTAAFVVSAGLVLRLGIATTALAGAALLVKGELDVLTFFMFLLVVSRLYDPLEGTLQKLPDGWNTNIGENGCELSGGERQRISIARAFLKDAPIILLDEATASLDVENETAIQEALSRLIKNKTVLIIAHRMRTVSGADKIVVLKDGAVAEQGSPAQLLQEGGIFAHMVQLQTESQSWTLAKA